MTEHVHDVAHIAHAELLTPKPEESLRFFVDVLGMEEEAREGQSVYLRGWGDYLRYSLKLTESPQAGLGHVALRAWSPEALERRVAAVEATGLGAGWIDGDVGHGPAYRFTDPDGHVFELFYEAERYVAPPHLAPSWRNQPQRYVGRGAAVKRLDHVNLLAADVRPTRTFCQDVLGYRLYERIELDDGTETGAWMSVSIAAHELIYVADAYGARGRLHHLAFWVDTREECLRAADIFVDAGVPIEAAPSKHGVAQGFFLYGLEPGGNRIEVTTGGYFVFDPDHEPVTWSAAERARGQYLGREDRRELPHLRHPRHRPREGGWTQMKQRSLEDALQAAGSAVELARNSQIGPYVYPAVPSEFTNWREEQVAWRETCALFDQSHHMTDLYVEGPDVIRLLSDLGVNTFANAAVDKAKQFVACNDDGYVIGDAIVFFLDENRVSLVGRPSAHNWVQYHAETGDYDVTVERDERTAVNPTGGRKLYRYQVQGPTALDVLEKATGGPLPEIKFFNMGGSRSPGTRCGRSTTACRAPRAWSCSGRGRSATRSRRRSSRPGPTSACARSGHGPTRRTRSSPAGSPVPSPPSSPASG